MTANQHEEELVGEGEWHVTTKSPCRCTDGKHRLVRGDYLEGVPGTVAHLNTQQATITRLEAEVRSLRDEVSTHEDMGGMADQYEADITRLERELADLKSKAPYVEASGHYCDGMTLAWADAQIAISEKLEAERERDEAQKYAADLQVSVSEKMHTLEHDNYRLGRDRDRYKAALTNRAGYCWSCGNFTGEDKVQGGHGTEPHEDYCVIAAALTKEGEADDRH